MRNQVKRLLRVFGDALGATVHDRVAGVELRLDDLRAHSNQVETKADYLIALMEAQRNELGTALRDLHSAVRDLDTQVRALNTEGHAIGARMSDLISQVQDLSARTEDLSGRTQQLSENDGVMMQSALHIVESIHKMRGFTNEGGTRPNHTDR